MCSKGFSATSTASVQAARNSLTKFLKQLENVPAQETQKTAKRIYAKEIAMVPYSTGKLEKSIYCRVSGNKKKPGIVTGASARSGGYNYAGIQHENTSYNHPGKGEAFYISKPFNEEVTRLKAILLKKVRF